jgi:glutamine---fructose-6-phosphate transaminase (isomerizing)
MTTITETVIRAQMPYCRALLDQDIPRVRASGVVLTGCGSSYHLSQSLACVFNAQGQPAIAVPAAEWTHRPECYLPDPEGVLVIGLSRSGRTTETVQAIRASRKRGWATQAITCEPGSPILTAADAGLCLATDPREGIVMTVSACLMYLSGLRMAGVSVPEAAITAADRAMMQLGDRLGPLLPGRRHFVYLGAGVNYGIAREGCLKLLEMSLSYGEAYHPMEYRHGPVSLLDESSLVVLLYSLDSAPEEAELAAELQAKGATVVGLNGPGDLRIDLDGAGPATALAAMPALQLLGEKVAQSKGIDSETPRHLSRVVLLP